MRLAFLREHRLLVLLIGVGALVRIGVQIAYYPAFGYFADTQGYMEAGHYTVPSTIWPWAYPALLKAIEVTIGHIVAVSILQHLMGLGLGVMVYALLQRRNVQRSWSALAAAPVLLDSRQIVLEHFVLSEALFSVLLLTGIMLLMWNDKPSVWLAGLSGFVFALTTLTRTVGQALAILVVVYLVVRRIGWRQVAVFVIALAIPIGGYMVWFNATWGKYALMANTGRYMWQRTTTFVDCSRSDFTPQEREICPPEPLGKREVGDVYLWGLDKNGIANKYPWSNHDELYYNFAVKAITGQPVDFVKVIVIDTWHFVKPGWQQPRRIACTTDLWSMQSGTRASGMTQPACRQMVMVTDFRATSEGYAAQEITTLNSGLWAYGRTFLVPPIVLVLLALFAIFSAMWRTFGRRTRFGGREAADGALLGLMSIGLLLMGVTLSVIDLRFTVPLLVLGPIAAALSAHRLTNRPAPALTGAAAEGEAVEGEAVEGRAMENAEDEVDPDATVVTPSAYVSPRHASSS